jgi:hypothetical protein
MDHPEWFSEFEATLGGESSGGSSSVCYDGSYEMIPGCECHSSCGACGYYDWPDADDDCIYCPDGSEVDAVYSDGTGYCSGSSSEEGTDPVWYNFIVNEDEIGSWAVVATWDPTYQTMYLWTGDDQTCMLTTDWNDPTNPEAGAMGFYVSEDPEAGSCPFIEEYGYTYAAYTYD